MSPAVDLEASAAEQAADHTNLILAASEEYAAGVATLWIVFYTAIAVSALVHHFA